MLNDMIPILDTDQMRKVDQLMIEYYGITLLQMMENAGRNTALLAKRMLLNSVVNKKICVVSGPGNNGGGGLVAARHLSNWGAEVMVLVALPNTPFTAAVTQQLEVVRHLPVTIVYAGKNSNGIDGAHCDMIIDAIFGYGLNRPPDKEVTDIIVRINRMPCPVLSLDAPSGLDTTHGTNSNKIVTAHTTLTLALPKKGLLKKTSQKYVGRLFIGDISVPPLLYAKIGIKVGNLFAEDTIIPYRG